MRSLLLLSSCLVATPTLADVPRVAADIMPVHSLVARVMDGVGDPELILPPGASPHGFAMRPTQAAALERADIVFWVGEGLTPWLAEPVEVLAGDAVHVALLEADGTTLIETEGEHGHGEEEHADEHDHDDHAHDDHAEDKDHGHEDHADHDDHGHDDHAGHDHGPIDPHAWLDPANAGVWLPLIAETLAEADPANAATYRANAASAVKEIAGLQADMAASVASLKGQPFAVYHEAYAYLEQALGLEGGVSLLDTDSDLPTPRRIASLREQVLEQGVTVVFSEPGTNFDLIDTVFDGVSVTICEIDPIGGDIAPGPNHYWQTLLQISKTMGECGVN